MITYVAKKPTGQIKAWSVGQEKAKVKSVFFLKQKILTK